VKKIPRLSHTYYLILFYIRRAILTQKNPLKCQIEKKNTPSSIAIKNCSEILKILFLSFFRVHHWPIEQHRNSRRSSGADQSGAQRRQNQGPAGRPGQNPSGLSCADLAAGGQQENNQRRLLESDGQADPDREAGRVCGGGAKVCCLRGASHFRCEFAEARQGVRVSPCLPRGLFARFWLHGLQQEQ
jgi:hypothetical protein